MAMPSALNAPDDTTGGSFSSWIEKKLLELLAKDSDDSEEIGDEDYSLARTVAKPTMELREEIANTPLYKAGSMVTTLPFRAGYAALSGLDDAARDLASAAVKQTGRAVRAYGDIGEDVLTAPMADVIPTLASVPSRIRETTGELLYRPRGEEAATPAPRKTEVPKTAATAAEAPRVEAPAADMVPKATAATPPKGEAPAAADAAAGQMSQAQWVNTLKADFEVTHGTPYDPNSTKDRAEMRILADARREYPNATSTQLALKIYRGEFD